MRWLLAVGLLLVVVTTAPVEAQAACYTPQQALARVGERGCVEGTVTNTFFAQNSNGQPTFLDFGTAFTVVIWGDDRPRFNPPPESLRNRRLRVTGVIGSFRGKAQIVVDDPPQISEPNGSPVFAYAPPPTRSAAPAAPVRPTALPTPPPVFLPPAAQPPAPAAPAPASPTAAPPTPEPTAPPPPSATPEPSVTAAPTALAPTSTPPPALAAAQPASTPPRPAAAEGPVDDGPPPALDADAAGPPWALLLAGAGLVSAGVAGLIWNAVRRQP